MAQTEMDHFAHYLLAKRTVDDRALNRRVWERLGKELRESNPPLLRVADVGAGLATGASRFAAWGLFEPLSAIRYTGIEPREALIHDARDRLKRLPFPGEMVSATLEEFSRDHRATFDLVVAHAFLDIVPLSSALAALVELARPGGLLYLPITFDGETIFEPRSPEDDAVLAAYHASMEERGSSRTGRRLFHALRGLSADVLEIGSSDWVVFPDRSGYFSDEAFFLEFLLNTIEGAVRGRVSAGILDAWLTERRRQLGSADLVYCAHQMDVLARKAP